MWVHLYQHKTTDKVHPIYTLTDFQCLIDLVFLVRVTGVEPARLSAREPKSRMSANSIIPACIELKVERVKLIVAILSRFLG